MAPSKRETPVLTEPLLFRQDEPCAALAQLVEQLSCKQQVRSSSLLGGSIHAGHPLFHFPKTSRNRLETHMRDVRIIWPTLKPATLRKWVERGHVTRTEAGYNIAQINACILWPNMVVSRS